MTHLHLGISPPGDLHNHVANCFLENKSINSIFSECKNFCGTRQTVEEMSLKKAPSSCLLIKYYTLLSCKDDTGTILASFLYSLRCVDKILCVTIQTKPLKQYFHTLILSLVCNSNHCTVTVSYRVYSMTTKAGLEIATDTVAFATSFSYLRLEKRE